jgi:hypothetical protein
MKATTACYPAATTPYMGVQSKFLPATLNDESHYCLLSGSNDPIYERAEQACHLPTPLNDESHYCLLSGSNDPIYERAKQATFPQRNPPTGKLFVALDRFQPREGIRTWLSFAVGGRSCYPDPCNSLAVA